MGVGPPFPASGPSNGFGELTMLLEPTRLAERRKVSLGDPAARLRAMMVLVADTVVPSASSAPPVPFAPALLLTMVQLTRDIGWALRRAPPPLPASLPMKVQLTNTA